MTPPGLQALDFLSGPQEGGRGRAGRQGWAGPGL